MAGSLVHVLQVFSTYVCIHIPYGLLAPCRYIFLFKILNDSGMHSHLNHETIRNQSFVYIVSNCYFLRPIIFNYKNNYLDVHHG